LFGVNLKIAIDAPPHADAIIRELLSPWCISYTSIDEAELSIAYEVKPQQNKKTIIIPSSSPSFLVAIKNSKLEFSRIDGRRVSVSIDPDLVLEIKPEMFCLPCGSIKETSVTDSPAAIEVDGDLLLQIDVIEEYYRIVNRTINAKAALSFRLLTGLPVPYSKLVPQTLRNQFFKNRTCKINLTLNDKLSIDVLRFVLLRAIETITNSKIWKENWSGKRCAILFTHDVETREGLLRAKRLKKLENKYDLQSAWFIPSKRYCLDNEIVQELANHGEIGSHDTKHDAKLANLPVQALDKRLSQSKADLEKMANQSVRAFRSPLLQYNLNIIEALKKSRYSYDLSIPTWEPKHPSTMKPHGIETAFPLIINGLNEIPLTLPQDHQLLSFCNLSLDEIVENWLKTFSLIKSIGGLCTILVHPDYAFADGNMHSYERLLNSLSSNKDACIMLPQEINKSFFKIQSNLNCKM
jgi:peptidoglycan/xylan/chitin deacetylase (PgdA/CDA1 family)